MNNFSHPNNQTNNSLLNHIPTKSISNLWNNPYYLNEKNWAERIIIFTSLFIIVMSFLFGLYGRDLYNKDRQRTSHIQSVIQAIDLYYLNSSNDPLLRRYPIANCSSNLNSFDYDFTLKRALTGQNINLNQPEWISNQDWPQDKWGKYSTTPLPQACESYQTKIQDEISSFPAFEYCQFTANNKNCYLYTSSLNGDSYKLAFYNQSKGRYLIYNKSGNQTGQTYFEG